MASSHRLWPGSFGLAHPPRCKHNGGQRLFRCAPCNVAEAISVCPCWMATTVPADDLKQKYLTSQRPSLF
eukprot:1150091-Pelagomonas_calceolata.AAC.2